MATNNCQRTCIVNTAAKIERSSAGNRQTTDIHWPTAVYRKDAEVHPGLTHSQQICRRSGNRQILADINWTTCQHDRRDRWSESDRAAARSIGDHLAQTAWSTVVADAPSGGTITFA